jgi:hypothetical protein
MHPSSIAVICAQFFDLFLGDHQVLAALVHAHSLQLKYVAREAGLPDWEPPLLEDVEVGIFTPTW